MRASIAASIVASIAVGFVSFRSVSTCVFSSNKRTHTRLDGTGVGRRWHLRRSTEWDNGGGGREEFLLKFCLFFFVFFTPLEGRRSTIHCSQPQRKERSVYRTYVSSNDGRLIPTLNNSNFGCDLHRNFL